MTEVEECGGKKIHSTITAVVYLTLNDIKLLRLVKEIARMDLRKKENTTGNESVTEWALWCYYGVTT